MTGSTQPARSGHQENSLLLDSRASSSLVPSEAGSANGSVKDQSCASDGDSSIPSQVDDIDYTWIGSQNMAVLEDMSIGFNSRTKRVAKQNSSKRLAAARPNLIILPRSAYPVKLIGEGSANAVFELNVPDPGQDGNALRGLLLRVAKVPKLGQPLKYNYVRQQKYFHSVIQPILGNHAVHQELVVLRQSGIVGRLNKLLQSVNHLRKQKFRDTFIGESDWGFLVEDMRPADSNETLLIEFKPKWLLQSPSAPRDAIRCRQCALHLQAFIDNPIPKNMPSLKPCPLALVQDAPWPISSPFRIAPELLNEADQDHFAKALLLTTQHEVIEKLRLQQEVLDHLGPLDASSSDPKFPLAMTLRDCTCFAIIPRSPAFGPSAPIKVRLGDLDWKDPSLKMERWRSAERSLIEGGFYSAGRISCSGKDFVPPSLCALEWTKRGRSGPLGTICVWPEGPHNITGTDKGEASNSSWPVIRKSTTQVAALESGLGAFASEYSPFFRATQPASPGAVRRLR